MLATVIVMLAAATAPLQDTVAPMPPTPEQTRYLEGLRTVARGVAQLRDGIDRVARTQQSRDTLRQRQAGRRLGGLCTTARSFITSGRPRMVSTAYADSMRIIARQLVVRIDSIAKFLPSCSTTAGRQPASVAADLLNRMRAYETALAAFRAALAPPKPDSIKTPTQH
ncbi:MAG TPA: hypothetical protein VGQ18_09965 [Gemmatimonadales bacterium]|jgi:hypothetical protein|nr:hypothetical protein [Gemmatimonadales bacterium]